MEDTKGCKAYRYYPNELGAPRCKLYGMPVSYDVRDIDNNQPGMWYDLACGPPGARQQQQKVQRPQVQEKFTTGQTEGADQVKDKVKGSHGNNSTASSGDNGAGLGDKKNSQPDASVSGGDKTMSAEPQQPTSGNDGTMGAQPEPPTGGTDDSANAQPQMPSSGPVSGGPLGGKLKKGGLLGLGLGIIPHRK